MKTSDYLDLIINNKDLNRDADIARLLNKSTATIARWRNCRQQFGPETAMKVAEMLKIDPARIAADMYAQRASNQRLKRKWLKYGATEMVPERGLEPPTYALRMRRSTD